LHIDLGQKGRKSIRKALVPEWPAVRKEGAYLLKQRIAHRPGTKRNEGSQERRKALVPEWPAGWKEGAYPTKRIAHRPANKSKEVSK
jgi:hypothetical protein